jgi:hypothetical protein
MIDTWLFGSELELTWFPYILREMSTYNKGLLFFRRHCLSGSLDSLEQF